MKETEIKHVKWAVVGLLSLMFLTFAFRWVRNTWRENSSERRAEESRTVRIQNEPASEEHPRIVTLKEDVWTEFKTPPTGPRKSFLFDRVDPNLWIKYRINGDPMTENTIPPRNHPAFKPIFLERDSRGQNVKVNELCVLRHPDNPPNHEVKGYYVE